MHGTVTCLATVGSFLAIGYSSGTVLIYNLEVTLSEEETRDKLSSSRFELAHQFSFHKSAVSCLVFSGTGATQLISGGADTYIILYDLVASTAEFKLMGHAESITQLQPLVTQHPTRGTAQKALISSSKDGLLKVWDLQSQSCIGTFGEQFMSKVNDFCIVGELGLLVTASTDKFLRIFKIEVKTEEAATSHSEVGQLSLVSQTSFTKESTHRAIQVDYDKKRNLLMVLSADN